MAIKMLIGILAGILLVGGLLACAQRLGQNPKGEDLARLERSPNYADGKFHNQIDTPMFAEGTTFFSALFGSLFSSTPNTRPDKPLPAVKTDLRSLDRSRDAIVWLGHSSYLLILNGRTILLDPVLEDHAAPLSLFNRAFAGTTIYRPEDLPDIDCLLITHDHWDHLEYPTVTALLHRIKKVICPLGVGSHFRSWGFPPDMVEEKDWQETGMVGPDIAIHALPARHFSGRGLVRDRTLWAGYAVETPGRKIYISGDSGYGPHFAEAGKKFGGFDVAIVEDGQYDARWPYIHMLPEESAKAARELGARAVLPCHNGRFSMARHAWNEPVARFGAAAAREDYEVWLPIIGEPVYLP